MSLPRDSFQIRKGGREARLRVQNLPMPDTFQFANNVSVSGVIDVDVRWRAIADPVVRGKGTDVPPDDPAAWLGEMADASSSGRGGGASTGFHFRTGELTAEGFFAELGYERNGVFL